MKLKKTKLITALAAASLLFSTAQVASDDGNLSKLGAFKTTGTSGGESIPQGGKYADNLGKILQTISLPDGFKIELFALAPDARHMAVGRNKGTVWIGTKKTKIWAATDRDLDNVADTVEEFSPSVKFDLPNGVCYSPDGFLFVAERNRVLMFPAAEFFMESPDTVAIPIVPQGELIPVEEESYNHTARVCAIGPDNKLYISLGQPFNVSPPEKQDLYDEVGIGGMIRMNRDGSEREVIATGIRNSVGHAFNPVDGTLWFTDNQVDGMGDETPPGEINKISANGGWYGHPHFGGGEVRTAEYDGQEIPEAKMANYVPPQVETIAHAADLGMMFYTGNMFPAKYKNAIFSAQHGSWNAVNPRGARVMVTFLDEEGNAKESIPFAEGWLQDNGVYSGRPVDVQQYVDGSILVSDDKAGAVYRIYYEG
ncbi:MAG: PQQ-dependent sugar dehydrogenase [Acidiferrobacterales bacterium]|nr:PQQ-dependent sugar dehydrogenase [Acidiferrobacterales bacterium]